MKLLLKFVRPYWALAIAAPLLMLSEVFMDLMQPTLMARIVDVGIAQLDLSVVLRTGILMVGLAVVGAVGGVGCTIAATNVSARFAEDLRGTLFERVLSFSYTNINALETGSIVTRLTNDVTQVENTVQMLLRIMVRAPLMVIGSLAMAVVLSPSLSVVFVMSAPLIVVVFLIIVRRAYPLFIKVQEKMDGLNTRVYESLSGVRLVRSFVRQNEEQRRFDVANDGFATTSIRAGRVTATVHPLSQIILYLAIAAVLWLGGVRVSAGSLEIGKVIAVVSYLMQMLWSLIMVSNLIMQLSRAQASITRIGEILERKSELVEPDEVETDSIAPDSATPVLEFRNVTFTYDGEDAEPALHDVSFSVRRGEMIAILGETGSGKSSLVHLIPRLYDVDAGSILVDGSDVRSWEIDRLRRFVGFAPQDVTLFSGSITENLGFGMDQPEMETVKRAAATADIARFIDTLEEGYETDINQRGLNLSGGQKQRISIARALATDPLILILDDATSAVDTATEGRILSELSSVSSLRTTLIVAQRITTAMRADRIVLLDGGTISAVGTHEDLLETSRLYQEIFESQLGNPEAIDV